MTNQERIEGMLTGLQAGDALAMPAHWYYNQASLARDYGEIDDYLAPRNPHPDSILWRSKYVPRNARGEILHDQAKYWGERGVHYHQFLEPGENTLNVKVARLLWNSLSERGGWDGRDFLERYVDFMRTPGSHRDTYLEEWHRNFFDNYSLGRALERCAEPERHVGGFVFLFPVLAHYFDQENERRDWALAQLDLTHPGRLMEEGARVLMDVFDLVVKGVSPVAAASAVIEREDSFLTRRDWSRWLDEETRECLARRVGLACYIESAVPAILYLLLKHGNDPRKALVENTMAGGDNAYRGVVLGALLGAAYGAEGLPRTWIEGLKEPIRADEAVS